jgi:ABC-type dipeptide/oligopeptide/nickel transport system permease component
MLLGIAAGMREARGLDRAILMFSTVMASIPESRSVQLASGSPSGWAIAGHRHAWPAGAGRWRAARARWRSSCCSATNVSVIRSWMVEVMQRPYIRTAVPKGCRSAA